MVQKLLYRVLDTIGIDY